MYVYIKSEPGLWTVGFYKPDGAWEPESDQTDREQAAARVAYLNGTELQQAQQALTETRLERDGLRNRIEALERRIRETELPFRAILNWWMCSDPWPATEDEHSRIECWLNKECEWRNYRSWVEAFHEEPDEALNSGRGAYQP